MTRKEILAEHLKRGLRGKPLPPSMDGDIPADDGYVRLVDALGAHVRGIEYRRIVLDSLDEQAECPCLPETTVVHTPE